MIAAPALTPISVPAPDLRERLIEMRQALVNGMTAAPMIEPGHLALLGHVGAALAALGDVPDTCPCCGLGPDDAALPADWQQQDGVELYNEAIRVFRERYLAGEPLPEIFRRRSD